MHKFLSLIARQPSLVLLLLLPNCYAQALPPTPYAAEYDARFQGFRAKAEMSLSELGDDNYRLESQIRVSLLGSTLATINEDSLFTWQSDHPQPLEYHFQQTGFGKKTRNIEYDWNDNHANTLVDDIETQLNLEENILDELSMYVEIKLQVAAGVQDIYLDIIDEDKIKQYHYKVLGEELLETPLGLFNAVKIARIRPEESKRVTELWLATDWDYLLLKLYQLSSSGKESYLHIRQGNLDDSVVTALSH